MENNNAKHFALQLGSLISLYVSIVALIQILFGFITVQFPDPLNPWELTSASGSMRWGIALLVVFFPTYLVLTRTINVARRSGAQYLSFMKWLIYLSLVVGGAVLLGDLVSIIFNFLNGELTTRFLLKALTVLVVVGSAFVYYVYDARNYWQTHEARSKQYAYGVIVLVIASIILAYTNIESPAQVRERTTDEKQISDLSMLQAQILNHYVVKDTLPASLEDLELNDSLPKAQAGRDAYTYERTSADTFELCAEFAFASDMNQYYATPYYEGNSMVKNPDDWSHEKGAWCFTRVVNPQAPSVNLMKI
jgi:competence protein ComGC